MNDKSSAKQKLDRLHTDTGHGGAIKCRARRTLALIATDIVDTCSLATDAWTLTFVLICHTVQH